MPGFAGTMREWKGKQLHSGSKHGPLVRSQKQALAIAFSEQRAAAGKPRALTKATKKHAAATRRRSLKRRMESHAR